MEALVGPVLVAAVLLALAGAQKLVDPGPTMGALRAQGLPSSRLLVRLLALTELVVGSAAVALGHGALIALVGAFYLGFAVFVLVALRTDRPLASCGCFGREDTPPTTVHVVVNAVLALTAAVHAPAARPLDVVLGDQPAAGVPLIGFVVLGVFLTWLALAVLPLVGQTPTPARVRS